MPTPDALADYFKKSGDKELGAGTLEENEHGFCVWRTIENKFVLVNVYGDGVYWNKWAEQQAKQMGMKTIFFATKRKPDAFVKKHGFTVAGYILERVV